MRHPHGLTMAVLFLMLAGAVAAPAPLERRAAAPDADPHPAALCGDWNLSWGPCRYWAVLRPGGEYLCGSRDGVQFVGGWKLEGGRVVVSERCVHGTRTWDYAAGVGFAVTNPGHCGYAVRLDRPEGVTD